MIWNDPYLGEQQGERCPEVHPVIAEQCVLHAGHQTLLNAAGTYHRCSADASGRSTSWYTQHEHPEQAISQVPS